VTRRLRLVPPILAIATLAGVWLAGHDANPGPPGFRLDDAWIHMVYGRGLLANGYPAYEDGVPSTGCTSPAWAIVLAALHAASGGSAGSVVIAVLVAGAALHVAAAVTAASAARLAGADESGAALAGGLVAIAPALAAAALSGMEVALTGLLLLGTLAAAGGGHPGRTGLWLAAAGLARPEAAAVLVVVTAAIVRSAPAGQRGRNAARLLAAPLVAGAAFVAYDLWASGAPLPATFYAKSDASLADLPRRLGVALSAIVATVPPFALGLGWIAAAGVLADPSSRRPLRLLPLAAGAAYLVANVLVLDPRDPAAFYHQRYVLPALPPLLVAVALGARGWGARLARAPALPALAAAAIALAQAGLHLAPTSRHLHNDVRNINEVQRRIGEWLGANLPAGTRVAASDAGAIRYFSRLPTLDVIGLNTPGLREPTEEYARTHPVAALAFLPAWFRTPDGAALEEIFRATTPVYTVTSNPAMATQVVVRAPPAAGRVRARFGGYRAFALDFDSPRNARSANVRDGP